jgi:hypothetical protein
MNVCLLLKRGQSPYGPFTTVNEHRTDRRINGKTPKDNNNSDSRNAISNDDIDNRIHTNNRELQNTTSRQGQSINQIRSRKINRKGRARENLFLRKYYSSSNSSGVREFSVQCHLNLHRRFLRHLKEIVRSPRSTALTKRCRQKNRRSLSFEILPKTKRRRRISPKRFSLICDSQTRFH